MNAGSNHDLYDPNLTPFASSRRTPKAAASLGTPDDEERARCGQRKFCSVPFVVTSHPCESQCP